MLAQKIRKRSATSEKLEQLTAKESSAQLTWILKANLRDYHTNIMFSQSSDPSIAVEVPAYAGLCHTIENSKFVARHIAITQGLLIFERRLHVHLRDCFVTKKKLHQQHNTAFFVTVKNNSGQLVLIYAHPQSVKEVYHILKQQAKQSNFLSKFRLREVNFQNFYQICRKKTRKPYTAQLFNKQAITCSEQVEILANYLQLLRSLNVPNYPPIVGVFDDPDILALLFPQFQGITFEQVLLQNRKFNQYDLVQVVQQLLITLKTLSQETLYHGCVSLSNIVLLMESKQSLVYLINSNYKQYDASNMHYYLETIPNYLIAPEVLQGKVLPSAQTDIYQLGISLALLTFFPRQVAEEPSTISKQLESVGKLIEMQEQNFSRQAKSDYANLFSASQLDLIKKMIHPSPQKRITPGDALKHSWFINTKDKLRNNHVRIRKDKLPSLKTIIELKEQSERDIFKQLLQHKQTDQPSVLSMNKRVSIQHIIDNSPFLPQDSFMGDLLSVSDFDEDHQLGDLISTLNMKNYTMLPSQSSHSEHNQLTFAYLGESGECSQIAKYHTLQP